MHTFLEEYGAVIVEFVILNSIVSVLYKILIIVWELKI